MALAGHSGRLHDASAFLFVLGQRFRPKENPLWFSYPNTYSHRGRGNLVRFCSAGEHLISEEVY